MGVLTDLFLAADADIKLMDARGSVQQGYVIYLQMELTP